MDLLQLRENEVFETIKRLSKFKFVIIGGYAVNAYTLPRFSIDCDIVIRDRAESQKIETILLKLGYLKKDSVNGTNTADFRRYEKKLTEDFKVSIDILIGGVFDRQTNTSISSKWIFNNSRIIVLRGKTIIEKLKTRIINVDALFAMKMISCRSTDIRDIFMLSLYITDKNWIKREVSERCDLENQFKKIKEKITSKEFRKGLQGVYGLIDDHMFEKSTNAILSL